MIKIYRNLQLSAAGRSNGEQEDPWRTNISVLTQLPGLLVREAFSVKYRL